MTSPPPPDPASALASLASFSEPAVLRSRLWLLAGAVVATIGLAIFSMVTLKRQADKFAEVPQAIDGRRAVRLMVLDAMAAESAQRGYLLTGDRNYLDDFFSWNPDASISELRRAAGELIEPELVELEAVLAGKQREMQSTIELFDSGERDGALDIIKSDLGKAYMKRARAVMNTLIVLEAERVDELFQSALSISQVAVPLIIGGTGLTVLALITGFFALRNSTRALTEMVRHNTAQAARLEQTSRELSSSLELAHQTNRALALSNRDLDQFAYVASHDLKAPLRAISSLSTWIEEDLADKIDDKAREHLRLMRSRIDRMAALIEGILGYSRAGREADVSDVEVRELVEEIKAQQLPSAEISIEVLDGPWPTLKTQRVQLMQVWNNLLANAMKHGVPQGGRVQLGCSLQDDELCFSVHDDGPGIEPAYHDKIFDLFQRLVSRDKVEGAGIGLSVVRKLVDRNGGRIWIESQPGQGTTFKFTWSPHDGT
jgi:signal transduction histidine kinase